MKLLETLAAALLFLVYGLGEWAMGLARVRSVADLVDLGPPRVFPFGWPRSWGRL